MTSEEPSEFLKRWIAASLKKVQEENEKYGRLEASKRRLKHLEENI
jgi:hypothetical protein